MVPIIVTIIINIFLNDIVITTYYTNTSEIPGELSRENLISSHVKISPLLWLHNKSLLSHQKTIKMKWCGSSLVFIINRILHGRLEIRNFSSSVEKYFTSERSERVKYFSTLEEKFRISARLCNILYLFDFLGGRYHSLLSIWFNGQSSTDHSKLIHT